jgi:hypothetical protein
MPDRKTPGKWDWMAIVAALLLAGYMAFALYALFSPSDDPQRGMANGFSCLTIVIFVSLEALLWFGVSRGRRWIVRTAFAIAALPALALVARLVYLLVHLVRGGPRA